MWCRLRICVLFLAFVVAAVGKPIYVHRAKPKTGNPNGPCSTILELPVSGAQLNWALEHVGMRLGIEVSRFVTEDGLDVSNLDDVPAHTLLTVHEASVAPDPHVLIDDGSAVAAVVEHNKASEKEERIMRQLLFHRHEPKVKKANGPCSTGLEVPIKGALLSRVLSKVGRKSGIEAVRLTTERGELVASIDDMPALTLLRLHEANDMIDPRWEPTKPTLGKGSSRGNIHVVAGQSELTDAQARSESRQRARMIMNTSVALETDKVLAEQLCARWSKWKLTQA